MLDLWEGIRKLFAAGEMDVDDLALDPVPTTAAFKETLVRCLRELNTYSPGTAMYILNCLYPDDSSLILDLLHFDLSYPHRHRQLSKKDRPLKSASCEDQFALLRTHAGLVFERDYPHFWLELAKNWLLTCPVDPAYYREDETGKELFCQRLRSELVERILNIN